jgi:hypothetical protein
MEDFLAPIIDKAANNCWLGYGSALFLEFGQLRQEKETPRHPTGEWTLTSDKILWRVESNGRAVGGSEDDRSTMEAAVRELQGKTLISSQSMEPSGDSILTFSDGVILRAFALLTNSNTQWELTARRPLP